MSAELLDPQLLQAPPCFLPVGLDPSQNDLAVVVALPDLACGQVTVRERFRIPNTAAGLATLRQRATAAAAPQEAAPVFIFEASNNFWRPMYAHLRREGALTRTVRGPQTKATTLSRARKRKSDYEDAAAAVKVFLLGEAHDTFLPQDEWLTLRELERTYHFLDKLVNQVSNRLESTLLCANPSLLQAASSKWSRTILALLQADWGHAQRLQQAPPDEVAARVQQASRGHWKADFAQQLQTAAREALTVPLGVEGFTLSLRLLAQLYEHLTRTARPSLQEALQSALQRLPVRTLTSIPGFQLLGPATFLGEIGCPQAFDTAKQVVAFFGFDPVQNESSGREQRRHLSKSGSSYARHGMWMAAFAWTRACPWAQESYRRLRAQGRSHDDALVILAAKLTRVAWTLWSQDQPYDPRRCFPEQA